MKDLNKLKAKVKLIQSILDEVLEELDDASQEVVKIPIKNVETERLPGACFDDCTQECVDEPFHKNCPGYDDLE